MQIKNDYIYLLINFKKKEIMRVYLIVIVFITFGIAIAALILSLCYQPNNNNNPNNINITNKDHNNENKTMIPKTKIYVKDEQISNFIHKLPENPQKGETYKLNILSSGDETQNYVISGGKYAINEIDTQPTLSSSIEIQNIACSCFFNNMLLIGDKNGTVYKIENNKIIDIFGDFNTTCTLQIILNMNFMFVLFEDGHFVKADHKGNIVKEFIVESTAIKKQQCALLNNLLYIVIPDQNKVLIFDIDDDLLQECNVTNPLIPIVFENVMYILSDSKIIVMNQFMIQNRIQFDFDNPVFISKKGLINDLLGVARLNGNRMQSINSQTTQCKHVKDNITLISSASNILYVVNSEDDVILDKFELNGNEIKLNEENLFVTTQNSLYSYSDFNVLVHIDSHPNIKEFVCNDYIGYLICDEEIIIYNHITPNLYYSNTNLINLIFNGKKWITY